MEYAPHLFNALRGVFCVYKPAGHGMLGITYGLKNKLANDLNQLPCRPPRQRPVFNKAADGSDLPVVTTVPDLSDHVLVGPRYLPEDFYIRFDKIPSVFASGLVVGTINYSKEKLVNLNAAKYLTTYHIEGELGTATHDFTTDSKIVERSSYRHVTRYKIDSYLASVEAGHRRQMFLNAGIDPQSQEAYELACQGFIRPSSLTNYQIIYMVKCIDFKPPNFTIEMHTVNETFAGLASLVHEMGLELKTNAVCTRVRRIRYGPFNLSHALVRQQWTPQFIIQNIRRCLPLVAEDELLHSPAIKHLSSGDTKNSHDPRLLELPQGIKSIAP